MTEFVDWKPEYEGHKPRFWVEGMAWQYRPFSLFVPAQDILGRLPGFYENRTYHVPREAVYGPEIDTVLYERMVKFFKGVSVGAMGVAFNADELRAIAAELEPVDPILKLAREVCDDVFPISDGQKYADAKCDGYPLVKVSLAMAKAMKERGL